MSSNTQPDRQRGAAGGESGGHRGDPDRRAGQGGDRGGHHVRVDAQRGHLRGVRLIGVGSASLGGQRAHLARGVRALQGGQVDHGDGQVDRGQLAGLLDGPGGEPGGTLLEPDRVDPRQAVQEAAQRRLVPGHVGQVGGHRGDRCLGRGGHGAILGPVHAPDTVLRVTAQPRIPENLDVTVVDHPLAAARLSTMRDTRTDNAAFRAALRELTLMLIYEASRDLAVRLEPIRTPMAPTLAVRLSDPPLLVPVLRAGLGMADQAHALIPESQMGFVGLARDEQTLQPTPYMESLPESLADRPVYVLDPMLATGGSMVHTIRLLTERGATDVTAICALAAPEGLATLAAANLPVRVVTASVDERLNEIGYIVPGLGDAGDRQFGAV